MDHKDLPLKLLKESILSLAYYEPTADFYNEKSVGIAINGKPLIIFGESKDVVSNEIADRLLKCTDFFDAVEYKFGNVILSKIEIENKSIDCKKLLGIRLSKQGNLDTPIDLRVEGAVLEGIFLIEPKSISSLALHCCIQTNIMKCFHPEAKRLSYNLEINERKKAVFS